MVSPGAGRSLPIDATEPSVCYEQFMIVVSDVQDAVRQTDRQTDWRTERGVQTCMCTCVCVRVLVDAESEKTMSVLVDNVETLVHFIDVDVPSQQVTTSSSSSLTHSLTDDNDDILRHVTDDITRTVVSCAL